MVVRPLAMSARVVQHPVKGCRPTSKITLAAGTSVEKGERRSPEASLRHLACSFSVLLLTTCRANQSMNVWIWQTSSTEFGESYLYRNTSASIRERGQPEQGMSNPSTINLALQRDHVIKLGEVSCPCAKNFLRIHRGMRCWLVVIKTCD
jgi:hypothetical protein